MPPTAITKAPLVLIHGDDEFAVKQRARQLFQQWSTELGGMDHEIIDAQISNSGEALKALARLREALQTLPFFGTAKAIWLQNCSFLGDDRTASSQAVSETMGDLAQELKTFLGARLADHMVPAAFVFLDDFPLNDNGKVDRKRNSVFVSSSDSISSAAFAPADVCSSQMRSGFTTVWVKFEQWLVIVRRALKGSAAS